MLLNLLFPSQDQRKEDDEEVGCLVFVRSKEGREIIIEL